jgi:hypothetical protein
MNEPITTAQPPPLPAGLIPFQSAPVDPPLILAPPSHNPATSPISPQPNGHNQAATVSGQRPPHRFTRETARFFAAKSLLNRKPKASAIGQPTQQPQPPNGGTSPTAQPFAPLPKPASQTPPERDAWTRKSHTRSRALVELVFDRLEGAAKAEELDAGAIDRLASALARLGDLERVLAGRPLPGSRKPAPEPRQVLRKGGFGAIEPTQ